MKSWCEIMTFERNPDENGWQSSSSAWIERMAERGDFAREHVLDGIMLDRSLRTGPATALDVGCGEGRFCRMLAEQGVHMTGLDPVQALLGEARRRHPDGTYVKGFAEELPFPSGSFDLVISYLSLIDIEDIESAIQEMARVLRPGGTLLIANLTSFATSNGTLGWIETPSDGQMHYPLGTYLEERADWFEWDGLRIRNWHRPLSRYMTVLLQAGLQLTLFLEPEPTGGPKDRVQKYKRTPFLFVMEWKRPADRE